jgi:hypothetical protein
VIIVVRSGNKKGAVPVGSGARMAVLDVGGA